MRKRSKEEVIQTLRNIRQGFMGYPPFLDALDMAIEALQILGDDGIVNCCGCIHWKTDGGAMMMCELWDTPMGDFDYCSYGKRDKPTIPTFTESAEAYKAWTEMGKTGDLISRKKVLNVIKNADVGKIPYAIVHDVINGLPTVSADRPHGEWKQTITWQPYCSNCEYVFDEDEEYSPFWKFCPMCGAEMADNSLVNDITESSNDVVKSKDDVIELPQYAEWKYAFDNLKVVKK